MTSDVRAALEAGDDGFHEIQLNGKQLVFLGMATTLVSVVIFLCGVLVGRGVKPLDTVAQAAGPQTFDAPATASVAPGAIATPDPAPVPPASGTGSGVAAAGAAVTDGAAGGTEPTPLGDEADTPAPTDVAPAAPPAAARPVAPAVEPKVAPKVDPKARPNEIGKPKTAPVQAAAAPPAVKPAPAPAPAPVAAVAKPTPAPTAVATTAPAAAGGPIAVQVGAFKTRNEADALAKRLSGRGYAVYVMAPTNDGKNVYRVRVGNYASADEAQRISAKLTSQEKLKPWITR
jgi:DedD protein